MNTTSSKRGFATSWHTDINRKLKVGDKFLLGTIVGKMEFTVVSIKDDVAVVESGMVQAKLKKVGPAKWRYNHITWSKDTWVKVQVVDDVPKPPKTHKGFSKTYK